MDRNSNTARSGTEPVVSLIIAPVERTGRSSPDTAASTGRHEREAECFIVRAHFRGDAERLIVPEERVLNLDENDRWTLTGRPREFATRAEAEAVLRGNWSRYWNHPGSPVEVSIEVTVTPRR